MNYYVYLNFTGHKVVRIEADTPEEAYDKACENTALISEVEIKDLERREEADMVRDAAGVIVY